MVLGREGWGELESGEAEGEGSAVGPMGGRRVRRCLWRLRALQLQSMQALDPSSSQDGGLDVLGPLVQVAALEGWFEEAIVRGSVSSVEAGQVFGPGEESDPFGFGFDLGG